MDAERHTQLLMVSKERKLGWFMVSVLYGKILMQHVQKNLKGNAQSAPLISYNV
jgi:hypothetical protein